MSFSTTVINLPKKALTAKWLLITAFVMLFVSSCVTTAYISNDLTPMELIQRGQEASDLNKFSVALQYYDALIERFPTQTAAVIAAEYEIAFIHYKRRDFDTARTLFNNLLARYTVVDAELLPPQFKILSEIVLASINETESRRQR